jgi:hypothetical protein
MPKLSVKRAARAAKTLDHQARKTRTKDSFQNFALQLGIGTDNPLSNSTYGFNPITRVRILLEWIHRGSWLGGMAVDLVADDMTRAGIDFLGELEPEKTQKLEELATALGIWNAINDSIKWSRLYGGSIAVMLIDGQDMSTPLRVETVAKGAFKGLFVFDRWTVEPSIEDIITELGPSIGLPKYYTVIADAPALRYQRIHHSRVLRLEGLRLPYWQRITENMWGESVLERLYDRMVAFDSATTGAAQLVYKSFLRTLKLKNFRQAVASGGDAFKGVIAQVATMRRFQGQEGISVIDADDEFQVDDHGSFSGIADVLGQFGQQISGALQIPLVRLFGQSPAGLNSSGDSDLRTYYDGIAQQQEKTLKVPVTQIYRVIARSLGIELPDGFGIKFRSLWQMSDKEKAETSEISERSISGAYSSGVIRRDTALKELKQSSEVTGIFANISDEEIKEAEDDPPPGMGELGMPGAPAPQGGGIPQEALRAAGEKSGAQDRLPVSEIGGIPVCIETPMGELRKGSWGETLMPADYGYILGTSSSEGPREQMDCYVGPNRNSKQAWIVHQKNLETGAFDEHKVLLGYDGFSYAIGDYIKSFGDGRGEERIIRVDPVDLEKLRLWLASWRYNADAFEEGQHPRDPAGQFSSGGAAATGKAPRDPHRFLPGDPVRSNLPGAQPERVAYVAGYMVHTTRGNSYKLGNVRRVE